VNRTRFLAAIAVAAVSMQLFPDYSDFIKWVAIGLGVLYLVARALRTYPQQYRAKRRAAAQRLADELEFREYTAEMLALRTSHAASGDDFEAAVAALHDRHREMLERKFGVA